MVYTVWKVSVLHDIWTWCEPRVFFALQFGEIYFASMTNTFVNLNKCFLQSGQLHLTIWTNTFCIFDKYMLIINSLHCRKGFRLAWHMILGWALWGKTCQENIWNNILPPQSTSIPSLQYLKVSYSQSCQYQIYKSFSMNVSITLSFSINIPNIFYPESYILKGKKFAESIFQPQTICGKSA